MDIIKVKFRKVARCYQYNSTGFDLNMGDRVVVESERGIQLGTVMNIIRGYGGNGKQASLKKVIRLGTEKDSTSHEKNLEKEKEAHAFCLERTEERALPMKLVRTEYLLDGSKVIFYFTADGRVDFRELVKDLAQRLKTRIEMRQIGVRDESRMIGGIGPCGKELCCASHLIDFEPITVKLAKDQNLALNPAKLSGVCGRLLCCLIYEHSKYSPRKNSEKSVELLPEEEGNPLSLNYEEGHD